LISNELQQANRVLTNEGRLVIFQGEQMSQPMTGEEYSGELSYSDDLLTYRSAVRNWTLPISAIRLIGEYTNSDGPFVDDYFFVFLTAPENGWHEASFYAKGREEALRHLAIHIGAPIESGLCHSTDYCTRIIWPCDLKDQPLMDIIAPEKQNLWQRLIDSGARDITLSRAARQAFTR
jgi:hypothetical protein